MPPLFSSFVCNIAVSRETGEFIYVTNGCLFDEVLNCLGSGKYFTGEPKLVKGINIAAPRNYVVGVYRRGLLSFCLF